MFVYKRETNTFVHILAVVHILLSLLWLALPTPLECSLPLNWAQNTLQSDCMFVTSLPTHITYCNKFVANIVDLSMRCSAPNFAILYVISFKLIFAIIVITNSWHWKRGNQLCNHDTYIRQRQQRASWVRLWRRFASRKNSRRSRFHSSGCIIFNIIDQRNLQGKL